MKVFVTGATGVVGAPTVARLIEAGHEVRAIARREEAAQQLKAVGAEPVTVDLFDAGAIKDAVAGTDAIAHLATNVPPFPQLLRAKAWATHNRIRTEGTRNLVDAAQALGIGRIVKESVTFMYADGGDAWLDETSPLATNPGLMAPALEGEQIAQELARLRSCSGSGSSTAARTGAPTRCCALPDGDPPWSPARGART